MSEIIRKSRLAKEVRNLNLGSEHHGFNCDLRDDCLWVNFPGPKATVYENETFELKVRFDDMYPFSPPRLQLMTGIYHPNIDKGTSPTGGVAFVYIFFGDQQQMSATIVNITINDVNNKPPQFEEPKKIVFNENTPVGSFVYKLVAKLNYTHLLI